MPGDLAFYCAECGIQMHPAEQVCPRCEAEHSGQPASLCVRFFCLLDAALTWRRRRLARPLSARANKLMNAARES